MEIAKGFFYFHFKIRGKSEVTPVTGHGGP
jgi:hypothetical protein